VRARATGQPAGRAALADEEAALVGGEVAAWAAAQASGVRVGTDALVRVPTARRGTDIEKGAAWAVVAALARGA
jgi:hypothetical protein